MVERCWNVSPITNDLTVNGNGGLAIASDLEAKIVELRSRLRTLKNETEDGSSGIDLAIIYGDAPLYAKQGEIERVALTVPGVLAVKTTDITMNKLTKTISFHIRVVFEQGTVDFDLDTGEQDGVRIG